MKYYVTADTHSFFTPFKKALEEAGYFDDEGEKRIIICGDLMDRGSESIEMQNFVLELMKEDKIILVKGNHEDLFEQFCTSDEGRATNQHVHNGTFLTAIHLTSTLLTDAVDHPQQLAEACRNTPFYKTIIPSMRDYYETEHYIFVHGWIPCFVEGRDRFSYYGDWRDDSPATWAAARWYNGILCHHCGVTEDSKTIVCGHWHTSYGHNRYENKGSELGDDADFSPYVAPGIIALDACTARSHKVNVIVIED